MTQHPPGLPLAAWLADLDDARLVRLLELRADLTQPPPGSIAALAARAQSRLSVKAAADELDFLSLAVIDALLVLHADSTPVPVAKLVALIADRAPEEAVNAALDRLRERALVWGEATVRVAGEAPAGLPWHPGQVTLETAERGASEFVAEIVAEIAAQLDALDDGQLVILERLVDGSPVGRTRDAAPGTPADRPVQRLLSAGLLRQLDAETVILPRLVGQVMRGEEPGPVSLLAPEPHASSTAVADADAAAAGALIDFLREVELLLETLGAAPIAELRSGGFGVREVKRLTKLTGIDEQRLGLILELSAAAGLIAAGMPNPAPPDADGTYWAPTVATDRFTEMPAAARWHLLASTWLDLEARPGLIGRRAPDGKPFAALSDSLFSTAAPLDRRLLLGLLSELPPGAGLDAAEVSRTLIWRRPRWATRLQSEPVGDLLGEATTLGLVGRGAITTAARVLVEGGHTEHATRAMTRVLPEPIDHFLVQADLTVVVPGPLNRELADELAEVADVESAGAAMVYRVSESSVRRALDTGRTASSLQSFFKDHSKTQVPQGLTYLIDDVARRHGQLRVGMASSFLRCEDPALLAQVVATPVAESLALRLLAPTVAVSQASIGDVLAALRDAGFTPAAEDASGAIVDLRARGARVTATPHRRAYRPAPPRSENLQAIVAVLRRVASTPRAERIDPATAVLLLQQAAREQSNVVIGYVDPAGVASQRVVAPVSVRGGQLVAFDPASSRVRDFAIHRVTSVVAAEGD